MHLRVVRIRRDPAKWDESIPAMLAASEAVRQLPGCQSLVIAGDSGTGEGFAVSTWDTEEHARFARNAVIAGPTRALEAVGGQIEPPLVFEVLGYGLCRRPCAGAERGSARPAPLAPGLSPRRPSRSASRRAGSECMHSPCAVCLAGTAAAVQSGVIPPQERPHPENPFSRPGSQPSRRHRRRPSQVLPLIQPAPALAAVSPHTPTD
jgi:hypothetical protein